MFEDQFKIQELEDKLKAANSRASSYANILEQVKICLEEDDIAGALEFLT